MSLSDFPEASKAGLSALAGLSEDRRAELFIGKSPLKSSAGTEASVRSLAEGFAAALEGKTGIVLLDSGLTVAPVRVDGTGFDAVFQALKTLHQSLNSARTKRAFVLAVVDVPQPGLWGDVCNCDPESGSSLVIAVRACRGELQAGRSLGQPEVEYCFARSSLESAGGEAAIDLRAMGQRFLSRKRALQLAATGLQMDEVPGRLFWMDTPKGILFFAGERLAVATSSSIRRKYRLLGEGEVLATGVAVGHGIVSGPVRVPRVPSEVQPGDVLVVDRLEPAWYEAVTRAAAIVAKQGGRTSHAALMAADLGIPAIVGCPISDMACDRMVTVDCEQASRGRVLDGEVEYSVREIDLRDPPDLPLDIMLDMANPYRAFRLAQVPHRGIGLVRQEFIIGQLIGIHPAALLEPDRLDRESRRLLDERASDYDDLPDMFIHRLCEGIASLATAAEGRPVVLRLSDFKSDEYSRLIGGSVFEPDEPNPTIGLRGASRYLQHDFAACLEMECSAVRRVRAMGFEQIILLIPFVRTPEEGVAVLEKLESFGLQRGRDGLKIYMMAEVPSNLVLAEEFAGLFDGFSIGTSDLTQLMLGVDRNQPVLGHLFDEGHPALQKALQGAIETWRDAGSYVGVCGRGISSNFPLALWFARQGVDSLTVEPQRSVDLWLMLSESLRAQNRF